MNRRVRAMVVVLAVVSQAAMASLLLAGGSDPAGGFNAGAGLPERVLHFPPNQAVGQIALIDESYVKPEVSREFHPGYVFAPAQHLGPAQGDVRIPAGQCACLHLGGRGVTRQQCFDVLKSLGPNDVQDLDFLQPLQVDDAFLPYIARLTGVTHFCPVYARFTAKGWTTLQSLPHLTHICTPYGLTDAEMAGIATLQTVDEMEIVATRLTDAGLASIAKLRNLKVLHLEGTAMMTDEGLKSPCHAAQAASSAPLRPVHGQRSGLSGRGPFAQGDVAGDPPGHGGGTASPRPNRISGAADRSLAGSDLGSRHDLSPGDAQAQGPRRGRRPQSRRRGRSVGVFVEPGSPGPQRQPRPDRQCLDSLCPPCPSSVPWRSTTAESRSRA